MKLNPDCIRDILFTVEENTSFQTQMNYPVETEYSRLKAYSIDEVFYHIKQCKLSNLITEVNWFLGGACMIQDLSPKGHEFLANIRSDTNWAKTKEVASNVGSFSLDILSKIAVNIVSSLINKY